MSSTKPSRPYLLGPGAPVASALLARTPPRALAGRVDLSRELCAAESMAKAEDAIRPPRLSVGSMVPMQQKTVLRVDLPDDRKKANALQIIATVFGVDSIAVDIQRQEITVVGHGDPLDIVYKLRRKRFVAQIVSVGPAKEEKKDDKKDGDKKDRYYYKAEEVSWKDGFIPICPIAKEFTLDFLISITNNFSEDRIISQSRYGTIYKGVGDNGKCVAVMKLVHQKPMLDKESKNVIRKLTWVQHPNIVQLVGYCHHIAHVSVEHKGEYVSAQVVEAALCFEYLQGPTLDVHLSNEPCRLRWHTCYAIIMGICKGLHYLHSLRDGPERTISHLDLKPTNILLDRYMAPKIRAFGLPRIFASPKTDNIPEDMEASLYMPPEYINGREISTKVDVFSLGVIIIQIMAGKESYSKCAHASPQKIIQLVHEFWAKTMSETIWEHASCEVQTCIEIALKCVQFDVVMRPTITDIMDKLYINKNYTANPNFYGTREFTLSYLIGITNNFSIQNKVSHGGHAIVYKGELDNGEEIAVKKLTDPMPWVYEEVFKKELNNLTTVQHKNIVQLVGYCCHSEQTIVPYKGNYVRAIVDTRALCLEYLPGGSLDTHLSDDEACKLDWDTCFKIIKGTIEGLDYLHNGSNGHIYHLDLKPANILLDKDMMPKIGDFGLARLFDTMQTRMTKSNEGTRGYMPPEYITGQQISSKFDIFSLGVIILQMMAGKKQVCFDFAEASPEEFVKRVHGNWLKRLHAATGSCHASQEVMACIKIALRCVQTDRGQRPSITEIVQELTNIGTDESLLATSEGGQLGVLVANEAGHELQVTSETPKQLSVLRAFGQLVQRSCRRMALKMSCTSAIQDVALPAPTAAGTTSGGQQTTSSSQGTLIHFGVGSASHSIISRATTSTQGVVAHAPVGASVERGKGKQVEATDSEGKIPSFVVDEIGTSQLRDAPPVPQSNLPHEPRKG